MKAGAAFPDGRETTHRHVPRLTATCGGCGAPCCVDAWVSRRMWLEADSIAEARAAALCGACGLPEGEDREVAAALEAAA